MHGTEELALCAYVGAPKTLLKGCLCRISLFLVSSFSGNHHQDCLLTHSSLMELRWLVSRPQCLFARCKLCLGRIVRDTPLSLALCMWCKLRGSLFLRLLASVFEPPDSLLQSALLDELVNFKHFVALTSCLRQATTAARWINFPDRCPSTSLCNCHVRSILL